MTYIISRNGRCYLQLAGKNVLCPPGSGENADPVYAGMHAACIRCREGGHMAVWAGRDLQRFLRGSAAWWRAQGKKAPAASCLLGAAFCRMESGEFEVREDIAVHPHWKLIEIKSNDENLLKHSKALETEWGWEN